MATITALSPRGARVAVELDGNPWRTLPVAAVVEAGLAVGLLLDRERARALARARRRQHATDVAVRALARRDRSRAELDVRLARAGVRVDDRREALERASRAGLVDDKRFATMRARILADRGASDLLVLEDLERRGVDPAIAQAALGELDPEPARVARIIAARGRTRKTLRFLASRGFAAELVEDLVADVDGPTLR